MKNTIELILKVVQEEFFLANEELRKLILITVRKKPRKRYNKETYR
jgi:hypothetical protein